MPSGIYIRKPMSTEKRKEYAERMRMIGKTFGAANSGFKVGHGDLVPREARKRAGETFRSLGRGRNPNGTTKLSKQIRESMYYSLWRKRIFERDKYTCVLCGNRSHVGNQVYIEADHYPKMFAIILAKYNIKTMEEAISCSDLWDVNNGRTLCIGCHNPTKGRIAQNHFKKKLDN